ncbi:hypothetical protein M758_UG021100 [Ceratodon purpureus]|nr:hypothetical protein M758_UG021100 [Ceratodon purpureus]
MMASSSRRSGPGRPPRDARQLDLNQCFGESGRVISSEDGDSVMDDALDGEHGTPDSSDVTMLQNPPRVFLRRFNNKWKIGRRWLYWSKPPGGPIAGVMKCLACEEFKLGGVGSRTWGGTGCSTIQLSAVKTHEKSDDHKWSCQRWLAKHHPSSAGYVAPIEPGLQTMVDREKGRILTVMKLLYFVVSNDQALLAYVDQCKLQMHLATPNMPSSFEYSSYANVTSAMGFLDAISQNLQSGLVEEVKCSPVYSIMIDESTDQTCEPHLIVYVCYLTGAGSGSTCVQFVELMPLARGTGKVMFASIKELLRRLGFDLLKLVAIATDGAACMTGVHQGVVTRLRDLVPHLVGVHCIAHREALAVKDANEEFPCLGFIDRAANKVYEWLGRSVIWQGMLAKLLLAFREETRVVLQIHSVPWLSRGMVMERMVFCMPAILESWQAEELVWYTNITSLHFQFFIHLLADVLLELNKLNRKFQFDLVDMTSIASTVDVTINLLRRHYLGVSFGTGTKHLGNFLRNVVPRAEILYVDRFGCKKEHTLHYGSMPGCHVGGLLEDCIALGRQYVQKVIDSLNDRFPDLPIFSAARLFSPKHYPMDALDRGTLTEQWLNLLVTHFKWSSVLVDQANAEVLKFVEMLSSACKNRSMHEAWVFCGRDREFKINWPTLMLLWQAILVIPTSIAVCERGFSKQNWVKSERRTCLNLDILDALTTVSLNSLGVEFMDWNGIFDTWKTATKTNKRRALSLQEVELDG